MSGMLVFAAFIVGVLVLCSFRNNFIEKHNRSCMHVPHVIIMILLILSFGFSSTMTSPMSILCWIALIVMFVYYVKQYGFLSAIGIWLYNTLLFVLVLGAIGQFVGSKNNSGKK